MKPTLYVIVNRDLSMSPGKLAAQVAHATVGIVSHTPPELLNEWEQANHCWVIILEAEDEMHLDNIALFLQTRDYGCYLVCDEGANEVRPYSLTALALPIVDKDDPAIKAIVAPLKLHRGAPQPVDLKTAYNTVGVHGHLNRAGRQKLRNLVK